MTHHNTSVAEGGDDDDGISVAVIIWFLREHWNNDSLAVYFEVIVKFVIDIYLCPLTYAIILCFRGETEASTEEQNQILNRLWVTSGKFIVSDLFIRVYVFYSIPWGKHSIIEKIWCLSRKLHFKVIFFDRKLRNTYMEWSKRMWQT